LTIFTDRYASHDSDVNFVTEFLAVRRTTTSNHTSGPTIRGGRPARSRVIEAATAAFVQPRRPSASSLPPAHARRRRAQCLTIGL
jgi:hypothetical protein